MTDETLREFLAKHEDDLCAEELDRQIAAASTLGALPVEQFEQQLRAIIADPTDWLVFGAAWDPHSAAGIGGRSPYSSTPTPISRPGPETVSTTSSERP